MNDTELEKYLLDLKSFLENPTPEKLAKDFRLYDLASSYKTKDGNHKAELTYLGSLFLGRLQSEFDFVKNQAREILRDKVAHFMRGML